MRGIINGISMTWDVSGTGLPVLLIHGFPLSRNMWRPQVTTLAAAGYFVITPDLRGFGHTDAPEGPYSMELFADDMIALLDHLEIESAVIGGMSMGGYILLNLLERYPQRVKAACFLNTRCTADDEAGKVRRLKLAQDVVKFGPQVVADPFSTLLFSPDTLAQNFLLVDEICQIMVNTATAGLAGGLLAMRERKDYTALLPTFSQPALIIGGDQDQAVPLPQIEMLQHGLPDVITRIIAGGGHMANLEMPKEYNRCLLEFLTTLN